MVALFTLIVLQFGIIINTSISLPGSGAAKQPLAIKQGPMAGFSVTIGDPQHYWFQEGAMADSSTQNSIGANVTIRTVYDQVNQDAHSYWVGSLLANGAFVQVGYLNGISTTNQPYCCAWFYEFFPPGNTNSPPFIGPEGSAGPIGSWHTYSMISVGNGVWSFYVDGRQIGSSPSPGQIGYLGSTAANTGSKLPAAIAEVAQTTTDTDIIGPAEFKNFEFKTSSQPWQPVPTGNVHIGYGATSLQNLPNPYSVAEVEGKTNSGDFLAGSNIPKPGPSPSSNPCGSPNTSILWSPTTTCIGVLNQVSFSFVDIYSANLPPSGIFWISMTDGTGLEIFYTDYQNQIVPNPSSGQWTINQVPWHAVNVTTGFQFYPSASIETVRTNVFSVQLKVVGFFYSIPVSGATVVAFLPDSTNETMKTDSSGQVAIIQIPSSTYRLHITVPDGISSNTNQALSGPVSIIAKVFSLPELITIIIPPIFGALAVVVGIWRKEKQRQAMAPAVPMPAIIPANCKSCGHPLSPGANFCTTCGTPVSTMVP